MWSTARNTDYSQTHDGACRLPGTLCSSAAVAMKWLRIRRLIVEWQEQSRQSAAIAVDGGYVSSPAAVDRRYRHHPRVSPLTLPAPVKFHDDSKAPLASVAPHCAQAVDRARVYQKNELARGQAPH